MAAKSRADYFRQRREGMKQFNVTLPKERIEMLENLLEEENKTKTQWLDEKIEEEISKTK